jgi:hypothetical protein
MTVPNIIRRVNFIGTPIAGNFLIQPGWMLSLSSFCVTTVVNKLEAGA